MHDIAVQCSNICSGYKYFLLRARICQNTRSISFVLFIQSVIYFENPFCANKAKTVFEWNEEKNRFAIQKICGFIFNQYKFQSI